MCFSFEPPFIRYFPLPECRSPCELKRVVFRSSEIFEPTATMNSSGWQLWHSMVHLLKAKNQGLRGSAVSCSLRYRARALEPKKPSLVHQDKQLRECTTWFHFHIPYLHQESTAARQISKMSTPPPAASSQLASGAASGFLQLQRTWGGSTA